MQKVAHIGGGLYMKAVVDKRKCPADNRFCKPVTECPTSAITWIKDENEPWGARMEVDEEKCAGCGICVPLCCAEAIGIK